MSIYKRMLWSMRKLAYMELRSKIRENNGKLTQLAQTEVKLTVQMEAKEIRESVCKQAGIEPLDESQEILQKCYYKYINDVEFTKILNRIRSYHSFVLGKILNGELIKEIEHLDINNSSDEALDEINEEIVKKLSNNPSTN